MNALTQNTKITVSDINTLISECNGKLNLSGGTLTGPLNRTGVLGQLNTDTSAITISGGTDSSKCSFFHIYGQNHSTQQGTIQLRSYYNGSYTDLLLNHKNGTFTWGGNEIPTSKTGIAYKAEHDSLGNVISDMYFKKIVKYYGADATVDVNTFTDATSLLSQAHITGLSSPGDSFFYIIQLWYSSTSSSKVQIAIGYQTGNIFRRTYYAYNDTWTTWKKSFEDNNSRLTYSNGTSIWVA